MKKLLLVGALAAFGAMNAQEDRSFKPEAGDVTAEVGLSGGLGNTSVSLADQGFGNGAMLKGRYFTTDKYAFRAVLFLGSDSVTENPATNVTEKNTDTGFGIGFGMERHFTGTERLSPYVGGDVLLGFTNSKTEITNTTVANNTVTQVQKGPNAFRFGVRGVFGADYYFLRRVYLGVEGGLGLFYQSEGDTTLTTTSANTSTTTTVDGGSSFQVKPAVVGGLRLGFVF